MPLLRDMKSQLGSSYLLDHADNPVAWRTWGDDALEEARSPIVRSFFRWDTRPATGVTSWPTSPSRTTTIAALLNEYFVPIKVDREERPDVDALYMAATQLVSGHGGWPMSVFLLPDGRPVHGGDVLPAALIAADRWAFDRLLLRPARSVEHEARGRRTLKPRNSAGPSRARCSFVDHLAPLTESIDLVTVRRDAASRTPRALRRRRRIRRRAEVPAT